MKRGCPPSGFGRGAGAQPYKRMFRHFVAFSEVSTERGGGTVSHPYMWVLRTVLYR